jgi:predicted P-loop ATPase
MTVVQLTPKASWFAKCVLGDKGPLPILANACVACENDEALKDMFAYDEMERMQMILHPVDMPDQKFDAPIPLTDEDLYEIQKYIQRAGLKRIGMDSVRGAVALACRDHAYHPVRNYLQGLVWDGKPRANVWLVTYLGCDNSAYVRKIGEMFLIQMVARIMHPGCKADYMLILEGEQGKLKSTVCETLAYPYFSDSLPDIGLNPKDAMIHLRGKWLIEIAEMHAFSKAESTALKSFVSRKEERFRPPHGRVEVIEPRQCVFIGTTNKEAYLKDETGGRRFWPVKVGTIDIERLEEARDQLFAEALHKFRNGFQWWPDQKFEADHMKPEQEARYDADVWEDKIAEFVATRFEVTVRELGEVALQIPIGQLDRARQMRIASILKRLNGWKRHSDTSKRVWIRS